jgi:phosphopantothenoylcysteine decarboxylase/phosphopantothenate--cysteine ligase
MSTVALGVGGGIAAYKSAELARALMERGFTVQAILTRSATEFIRPLTFAALTGREVITDLFTTGGAKETLSSAIEHIRVAQDNEILVVAPATADLLAKFAHGIADDFLTTTYLAFTGRVVLAPAMNTNMWKHPATVENVRILASRGHEIVDPEEGVLACGMVGPGRLAGIDKIAEVVARKRVDRTLDLDGDVVLITAGPTQEPLDAVRYITNRSSGKMGFALAEEAAARGGRVILISGPVHIPDPAGVEVVHVRTALEMRKAVLDRVAESNIIIKSAAVADYHRSNPPRSKEKKTAARLSLELDPTPDILAEVGRQKGDRLLVGFAAETDHMTEEAKRKLESKNCDMIVANLVSQDGIGFDSEENEVLLVTRTGQSIPVERAPKREIARRIFDELSRLRLALHASK